MALLTRFPGSIWSLDSWGLQTTHFLQPSKWLFQGGGVLFSFDENKQTNKQADTQSNKTDRQASRQTNKQTDKQTERQERLWENLITNLITKANLGGQTKKHGFPGAQVLVTSTGGSWHMQCMNHTCPTQEILANKTSHTGQILEKKQIRTCHSQTPFF